MDQKLLHIQQYYLSSSIQFLTLYLTSSTEPHISLPRLFLAGHALECMSKAAYISRKNTLPKNTHKIDNLLSEIGFGNLFSPEECAAYRALYGEGFEITRNFDIGLMESNREAVEVMLILQYLKDLKYGIDINGTNIVDVITTSSQVNRRFLTIYKSLFKIVERDDLSKLVEMTTSSICAPNIKTFVISLLS